MRVLCSPSPLAEEALSGRWGSPPMPAGTGRPQRILPLPPAPTPLDRRGTSAGFGGLRTCPAGEQGTGVAVSPLQAAGRTGRGCPLPVATCTPPYPTSRIPPAAGSAGDVELGAGCWSWAAAGTGLSWVAGSRWQGWSLSTVAGGWWHLSGGGPNQPARPGLC